MAKPTVSDAALELYEGMAPAFTAPEEAADSWPLLEFCAALVSGNVDLIHELVTDSDLGPGWQILLDPDNCPAVALPFLAQFVGAELREGMTTEQIRAAIKEPEGFGRGTVGAIRATVKRRLTGTQTVAIIERYTGLAYRLQISTIESETPDADAIVADLLREQKPGGIRLFFNAAPDWTWDELALEDASWNAVVAKYASWDAVATHTP